MENTNTETITKEELESTIYEFDDVVRAVRQYVTEYNLDKLEEGERYLLEQYIQQLSKLEDTYDALDRKWAEQTKRES